MLNPLISVSNLCLLLDSTFGKGVWGKYEPETVMIELGAEDHLFVEKFRVLQVFAGGVMKALSRPEFLLWSMAVMNNEPAEFEWVEMPSCLELAWGMEEAKKVALIMGQTFEYTDSVRVVIEYLLKEEGFSEPTTLFNYLSGATLEPGAPPEAMALKEKAMQAYIAHMEEICHV